MGSRLKTRKVCQECHGREVMNALHAHDRRRYTVDVSDDALDRIAAL